MRFIKHLENQRVKEGLKATFVCAVNKCNATVTWYKNGVKIRHSKKYLISSEPLDDKKQEHTLVIADMQPDDVSDISAKATLKGYADDKTTAKLEFSPEGRSIL